MPKSKWIPCLIALAAASIALPASGALMVTVGNYTTAAGNSVIAHLNVTNSSSASSSDIEGMTFTLQIADGSGSAPKITSIDFLDSTIWSGHVTPPSIFTPAGGDLPQYQSRDLFTDLPGDYVDANGLLATITIDTTGASGGTYSIQLVGTNTPGADSAFSDGLGNTIPASFTAGNLIISPAPESSQFALLPLSCCLLVGARGQRQVRHLDRKISARLKREFNPYR